MKNFADYITEQTLSKSDLDIFASPFAAFKSAIGSYVPNAYEYDCSNCENGCITSL